MNEIIYVLIFFIKIYTHFVSSILKRYILWICNKFITDSNRWFKGFILSIRVFAYFQWTEDYLKWFKRFKTLQNSV